MMKKKPEAASGPLIPGTYDSPTQSTTTVITIANIQTKATIRFLISIIIYLQFEKFCVRIYAFLKRSFTSCANTYLNIPKTFVIFHFLENGRKHQKRVKERLGHKRIDSTLLYIQLAEAIYGEGQSDEFISKTAKTPKEVCELIESGFEYVTEMDDLKFFKKRK